MINLEVLLTGCVGITTTIVSGLASWFFTRKKYNSEVDGNVIENMKRSLDFYKTLSDDITQRLEEALIHSKQLEKEVNSLSLQVNRLMAMVCVDQTCRYRQGGGLER